jgi:hypothetical protein
MSKPRGKKNYLDILNQDELKCFVMKFRGYTYEQIEKALAEDPDVKQKYTTSSMELAFYKGGRWHDKYQSWKKRQIETITEQISSAFIAQATFASQQVVKIATGYLIIEYENKKGTKIRKRIPLNGKSILAANQDILDRAGFKPVEKFQPTDADDIAESIIKRYEPKSRKKS